MKSLLDCREALDGRRTSARELLDVCIDRADDAEGEGGRVFVELQQDKARARAAEIDRLRSRGTSPGPWAGIPVSIKDLFDVAGETTRAGSVLLDGAPPAVRDAQVVERLRLAGFVVVGRTNMTEFAYSGVGINPHHGTPLNPFERTVGRIPGGSSCGAVVSVTDGMAVAGIGTDTGGSCRIPAALCGITGFKPTARRIPLDGVYPLSASLDSVGPLALDVTGCAVLDDVMAGGTGVIPAAADPADLSFAVLENYVLEGLDAGVAKDYQTALETLKQAGVRLRSLTLPELEVLPELNAGGGIAAAEAYAWHAEQLDANGECYDPRVRSRISNGAAIDSEALEFLRIERARLIGVFERSLRDVDAVLAPTSPLVAPPMSAFEDDAGYVRLNLLLLRNPSLFNFLDGCSISIPVHAPGTAPVGLMLSASAGSDARLLSAALGVEQLLQR